MNNNFNKYNNIFLPIYIISLIVAIMYFTWDNVPKKDQLPILTESREIDLIRLYADTPNGSAYLVVSTEIRLCYMGEQEWINTILGERTTCLWADITSKKN